MNIQNQLSNKKMLLEQVIRDLKTKKACGTDIHNLGCIGR